MNESSNHNTLAFHLKLLSKLIDINEYPFLKLVFVNCITEAEYHDLFALLRALDRQYKLQKEEGFLDFTSLLLHFAGMLNEKFEPNETIYALKKEGYYPSLLQEFIHIIEQETK